MRPLSVAALMLLGACKAPEDAPESISEPMVTLFSDFSGEEDRLRAATLALETALSTIELTGPLDGRVFTVPALTPETLGELSFPEGIDGSSQVPVAVAGQSAHPLAASIDTAVLPSQVCIESNSTVWYERNFESDAACFADGTCANLETTNAVHKKKLVIDLWYRLLKDYRAFSLEDGRRAMIARSWTDEPWVGVGGNNTLDLSFALEVWLENEADPALTDRFYAMWSGGESGFDDAFYATIVKMGMDEGYENADAYMSGDTDCGVNPDDSDRPEGL